MGKNHSEKLDKQNDCNSVIKNGDHGNRDKMQNYRGNITWGNMICKGTTIMSQNLKSWHWRFIDLQI